MLKHLLLALTITLDGLNDLPFICLLWNESSKAINNTKSDYFLFYFKKIRARYETLKMLPVEVEF
mgnify:FL=1